MAYRDDVLALNPEHGYSLDGNTSTDLQASHSISLFEGVLFTNTAITEDATNCVATNSLADAIAILQDGETLSTITSAQSRKAISLWVEFTAIQPYPVGIYTEGTYDNGIGFRMGMGNSVTFEAVKSGDFTVQVFAARTLAPNRVFHLFGLFEGDGFGDELQFYLDGVKQTSSVPSDASIGDADLPARDEATCGDVNNTSGLGGGIALHQAAQNGRYNHLYLWEGADAVLTEGEIREELFEKGCLPGVTIAAGTESAMQTSLDALSGTDRGDEPLNIRVSTVTGDGDLTLDADDIMHDDLASIHVQYMGTGTLTWRNINGSNASIVSAPNGGTVDVRTEVTVTITVLQADDGATPIENARVRVEAGTGGDLSSGAVILEGVTNASGVVTGVFDYSSDQPIGGRVRKGSSSPYFKTASPSGTITLQGLNGTVFMQSDE